MVTIIDFYADWCGPCKTQTPILEEIAKKRDDVELVKVDVDEEQKTANEYNVRSLPTLVLTTEDEDGEELVHERFVGVTDKSKLEDAIDSIGS